MSLEWALLVLRLLTIIVLYAFLVIVVVIIWRELRASIPTTPSGADQPTHTSSKAPAGRLRLVSAGEIEIPGQAGEMFALVPCSTLGRASDNHVVLSDACVSLYHARIELRDGMWWLFDLGSRNGTRLNGVSLSRPMPLVNGDLISIGQVQLRFEVDESGEAESPWAHLGTNADAMSTPGTA